MSRFQHRQLHGHPFYSHVIVDELGKAVAWSTSLNRADLAVRLRNEDDEQLVEVEVGTDPETGWPRIAA